MFVWFIENVVSDKLMLDAGYLLNINPC